MVQVNVKVHSILREVVGKPSLQIEAPDGSSVEDVLSKVFYQFKDGFQQKYHLGEGDGNLLEYFIIALNGILLPTKSGLNTKVKEGDRVDIMEPMAGG